MRVRSNRSLAGVTAVVAILACEDVTHPVDQTWRYEWRVANNASQVLDIAFRLVGSDTVRIPPGRVQIVAAYQWFLGPPPDASRDLGCVSAWASSGDLVFQESPARNDRWRRVDIAQFNSQLTMTLTDEDISPTPIVDQCALVAITPTLPNKALQLAGAARYGLRKFGTLMFARRPQLHG